MELGLQLKPGEVSKDWLEIPDSQEPHGPVSPRPESTHTQFPWIGSLSRALWNDRIERVRMGSKCKLDRKGFAYTLLSRQHCSY